MERYDRSMPVDEEKFTEWKETEAQVLSRWRREYREKGFHHIAPYNTKKDSIPTTYQLDKAKAPTEKSRLISNCSRKGAAEALKIACQALLFLLKERHKTRHSFNLQSVHDFPQVLKEKTEKLLASMGPSAMLMFMAGDIADFYPNLPHETIKHHRNKVIDEAVGSTRA